MFPLHPPAPATRPGLLARLCAWWRSHFWTPLTADERLLFRPVDEHATEWPRREG